MLSVTGSSMSSHTPIEHTHWAGSFPLIRVRVNAIFLIWGVVPWDISTEVEVSFYFFDEVICLSLITSENLGKAPQHFDVCCDLDRLLWHLRVLLLLCLAAKILLHLAGLIPLLCLVGPVIMPFEAW